MKLRSILLGAFASLIGASAANATVLATFTAGTSSELQYFGESVLTAPGGPFNNITFNFYTGHTGQMTPEASGRIYVFSSPYSGTPNGLAGASFLDSVLTNGSGVYVFDSAFTLQGNTEYYFYTARNQTADYAMGGGYADGIAYFSNDSASTGNVNFTALAGQDVDFLLTGTPVPEPITFSLFGAGLAGALAMRRKKKAA